MEGYIIFRNSAEIARENTNTYNDISLSEKTSYIYTIKAFDKANNISPESQALNVLTPAAPDVTAPSIPQNLKSQNITLNSATLIWDISTDDRSSMAGYIVNINDKDTEWVKTNSYTHSNLTPGTTYNYKIKAYDNSYNISQPSQTLTVITPNPDTQAPSAPYDLIATNISSTGIQLKWTPSTDNIAVKGYIVLRNNIPIADTAYSPLTDTAFFEGINNSYKVIAYDNSYNYSEDSNMLSIVPDFTAPTIPQNINAKNISNNEITVSWDNSNDNTALAGYIIFRDNIEIAKTQVNTYTHSGLKANITYNYTIKAYDKSNNISNSSNVLSVKTKPFDVLGFATYYYQGDPSAYNSMSAHGQTITEIATETFFTDGSGNLTTSLIPTNQLTFADSNGIPATAMLSNKFDGKIGKALLESPENRRRLISNIEKALETHKFKGINVDLEGLYYSNRPHYTSFVKELYYTLKPNGYIVTISIPAKTSDSPTAGFSGAYDYATLANYADQILLMTYDENYPNAGPVASIEWVTKVINYAQTVIPKEKILIGIAAYGYDVSSNGIKAYSMDKCVTIATQNNAVIQWDETSKSPYYKYVDSANVSHSVWFENTKSIGYKLDLVESNRLGGIGIWKLGLENASLWDTIKAKLGS